MGQIKTVQDIKKLGTILSVWAHPDDESFSCAGIMAAAVTNGQKVVCVTATKGELGVQDESRWPADQLGDIRAKEMKNSLKALGIENHHWLDYKDGDCNCVPATEAIAKLKELIRMYRPDSILTFGPDGMTGHTDHQAVSAWVDQVVQGTDVQVYHSVEEEQRYIEHMVEADKKFNIYFNIDKPPVLPVQNCDIAFSLSDDQLSKKCSSLKCMPSQTERMFQSIPADTMNAMLAIECFVRAEQK